MCVCIYIIVIIFYIYIVSGNGSVIKVDASMVSVTVECDGEEVGKEALGAEAARYLDSTYAGIATPTDDFQGRMLTYADVCGRMRTYADVCGRMLTYADVC